MLPEFEITKDGNMYFIKRSRVNNVPLIIPMILFKSSDLERVAETVRRVWSENA